MPTLEEIQAEATRLQEALDAEQQQVRDLLAQKETTIASLNTTIGELEVLVAEGGTTEQRQAVLDQLIAARTDLEGTVEP